MIILVMNTLTYNILSSTEMDNFRYILTIQIQYLFLYKRTPYVVRRTSYGMHIFILIWIKRILLGYVN